MIFRHTLPALAGLLLLAPTAQAAPPSVKATGAWCRAAPVGALTGGCYVTLTATQADQLVAVETSAATRAEIHSMSMDGGIMRMRKLPDGLPLPAGKAVALKPGGEHLMIIAPKQTLKAGGFVPMTLRFRTAPPLSLKAPIQVAPLPQGGR